MQKKAILQAVASAILGAVCSIPAHATIQSVTSSMGTTPTFTSNSVNASFSPAPSFPYFVNVGSFSGQNSLYDLNVTINQGPFSYNGELLPEWFFFNLTNESGAVNVNSDADITWDWAVNQTGNAGSGAIQALGQPVKVSSVSDAYQFGSDVTVNNTGDIIVNGVGSLVPPASYLLNLKPPGFRTAGLSGILAMSYGDQDDNVSQTYSGGNVTVNSSNSTISMSNTQPVITSGISATSANGPEDDTKDGTYSTRTPPLVQVNLTDAAVTNSAASGAGIIATNTGAQFIPGGSSSRGFGGNVSVNLEGNSSISLTGTTGVGIFAASEVYVLDDKKKTPEVTSGNVKVTISPASEILTGTANSTFSVGVLAVSAGTDLFLNPYTKNNVNGSGEGDAGAVTVTNNGTIESQGTMSVGITAMSLGGAAISTTNYGNQTSYLGNSQDTTALSANVTVTNNGDITTSGVSAYGIVALSSGGGGLVNNIIEAGGNATSADGLVIGGNGSSGGSGPGSDAGSITVTHNGSISTSNSTSIGLIAQSIGGAGGNGGGQHPALFVGDKGGNGGDGGTVTVNTHWGSTLTTNGTNALGVLAQSIGGGGGNGGNAAGIFVAVGGKGGAGGDGGAIIANLIGGSIQTLGDHSTVFLAQSVGGGGGHGGSATAAGFGVDAGIGGSGAVGGEGGSVSILSYASLSSQGNNSPGLQVQSVGGGGGTGGNALSLDGSFGFGVNVAIGGNGGNGSSGNTISAVSYGPITTGVSSTANATLSVPNPVGADSPAMFAQSIGGGGGHGGGAVARSTLFGGIEEDDPIVVSIAFTMGGNGGKGGDAGPEVTLTNVGQLTTYGDGSYGMLAQGVGGGGGNGGDSTASSTIHASDSVTVNATVTIGGKGSSGGNGSIVQVNNFGNSTSTITTYGQNAHGMVGQSIGGGGGTGAIGNAGAGNSTDGDDTYQLSANVGGNGGSGGNAGFTEMENVGVVTTYGSGSHGMLAQAIGGGGGAASGGIVDGTGTRVTLNLSIGGSGADGGSAIANTNPFTGLSAEVVNLGSISTEAGAAVGIIAQSIGGGGGIGGSPDAKASVSATDGLTDPSLSYSATLAVGGNGGSGGPGGPVAVSNNGSVTTGGDRSYGILAQSISGGGGMGGTAAAGGNSAFLGTANQFIAGISVGGAGGSSHNGSTVTVLNPQGSLTTTAGYGAHGIIAQSVAGGGGIGGDGTTDVHATLGLGIGVNPGAQSTAAQVGGAVTVTHNSVLGTSGGDSAGIIAQSIGGGGGLAHSGSNSRLTFNGTFSLLPINLGANLGINVGGTANVDGGLVTVNHGTTNSSANTTTSGDWSPGIAAQSLGGGGGKAATLVGTDTPAVGNMTFQLGAADGKGNGGNTTITLNGSITTGTTGPNATGFSSIGVLAQSIGGGGGIATDNSPASTGNITLGGLSINSGGNGGQVSSSGNGTVLTRGTNAHGVVLQSVGGGGGIAGAGSSQAFTANNTFAGHNIQLGGNQSDGNGGSVTFLSTGGNLTTQGNQAHALVAQSVGGGGGLVSTQLGAQQAGGTIMLGAISGDSNNTNLGGTSNVTISSGTVLSTTGNNSFGIVAQSIGGGGGIATTNQTGGTIIIGANLGNVNYENFGGGDVNVSLAAGSTLNSTGSGSHAIVAQSIGGGGGIANPNSGAVAGFNTQPTPNSSLQTHGYGSSVTVTHAAAIQTAGVGAFGILAQSIGGGGGLAGGFAGSTGGTLSSGTNSTSSGRNGEIIINSTGSISSTGSNSTAIFAQNVTAGAYGMGNTTITIGGTVIGGSGSQGYGVWVDGGLSNSLILTSGGYLTASSKNAINYTGAGNMSVSSNGTVSGSISLSDLSSSRGVFTQTQFASFYAEGEINAIVDDSGSLFIGTDNSVAASATFLGQYTQQETGTIVMDILGAASYDQMLFAEDGYADFNDEIEILFATAYTPQVGDTFALIAVGAGQANDIPAGWFTTSAINSITMDSPVSVNLGPGVEWETISSVPGYSYAITITAIPEPGTMALAILGLAALASKLRTANRPTRWR